MPERFPVVPNAEAIRRALGEFQIAVSEQQVAQIQQYMRMLLTWNDKINLTAIRDPSEMLYRHFCESMYAVQAMPLRNGRLADIGSGAGFPGLPIKILAPEIELSLVESNAKKATFLAEVTREMGLSNTRVLVSRYEELDEELAPLDVVCCRALGEFPKFLSWARSKRLSSRQVAVWIGGRDLEEVMAIEGWTWREPIAIPHSLRRYVLVGQPRSANEDAETR
jgi:16S rRNA (guanine527-N7)-methyltransferase